MFGLPLAVGDDADLSDESSVFDGDDRPFGRLRSVLGSQNTKMRELRDQDDPEIRDTLLQLLERTDESLRMSTELYSDFYADEAVRDEIERIAEKTGDVRILLDESVDVEDRQERFGYLFENENVEIKQSVERIPHWWISDEEDFRLEKRHEPGERGTSNLVIAEAGPIVAEMLTDRFDDWWYDR